MQIKNLTMSFGTQVLFENINLNIPENEKVGVVGVNGAGKTTSVLFDGIKKGVFSSCKFDSVPELVLARLLERDDGFIKTWLRPSPNEFNITYNNGRKYEPDFVVETRSTIYLVEVKADNQIEDDDVLAKKERAISYCNLVSKWANSNGNKQWKYLLIPASKISESSTFENLSNQFLCN